tara:strand:- start:1840 stop:2424 length:585 start_codon:yes stop_codon:yes gene_type:complete
MKDNISEDNSSVDTLKQTCNKCGAELTDDNWQPSWKRVNRKECKGCKDKHNSKNNPRHNPTNNPKKMYVNGKYISKKHPLYKAGRYKTFGDAAFSLLEKKKGTKDGYVYAIINPAWPNWVKIGMAIDAEDRLNGYQTSSPMRDYELIHSVYFKNRSKAERNAHKLAEKIAERKGEWFNITNKQAIKVLGEVSNG